MEYESHVIKMCPIAQGPQHESSPIPVEGRWVSPKQVIQISGLSHGVGTCAPHQGAAKLSLNVKDGMIEEVLIETVGCSGMTQSAAMATEILTGKTILEALNTDLFCDAINVAMREIFLQFVYGRTQTAFSEGGMPIGATLEDLGKHMRSLVSTHFGSRIKGPRYLEMADGYVTQLALDESDEIIGYSFVNLGKMMAMIGDGVPADMALNAASGSYGRVDEAVRVINPRHQ